MPNEIGNAIKNAVLGKNPRDRLFKIRDIIRSLKEFGGDDFYEALKDEMLDEYCRERLFINDQRKEYLGLIASGCSKYLKSKPE